MLGILQDLKLFNEEKFKFILRDIYPNQTPDQIYSTMKELELDYLKIARNKKQTQTPRQDTDQQSAFNIENFFTSSNLNFEKDYLIDINHVDYFITSVRPEEFLLPSGDSLIIEILGETHFNSITKTLNLKAESKLAILKKYGCAVSWISEEQCRKLSQIEKEYDQQVVFWDIIKENLIE